jgi:predicted RNA binding protein with dsRBD fold (UPF0201 family)
MEMNAPTYFEYVAAQYRTDVPRETDLVEWIKPETTETQPIVEWLRELER